MAKDKKGFIEIQKKIRVVFAIMRLLEQNGFSMIEGGYMVRNSTGCSFSPECITSYNSVLEFQMEYEYYPIEKT